MITKRLLLFWLAHRMNVEGFPISAGKCLQLAVSATGRSWVL